VKALEYKLSYIEKSTGKRIVKYFEAKSDKAALKYTYKFFEKISGQYEDPWLSEAEEEQLSFI
jgi:hypothetical protein